ncbi:hypothetical protein M3557_15685 [Bhargavaea ginsengi]|uniref:hypothetical protein n=1 Tax=Bhargavaea ginsengi TaxID=426757 RepID=UPI00203EDB6C|nr:hypothetical protein [Bhargavaea ginsengi]MCM3089352.1 hypothetical protein [Bhargavaea ginsengi]
MSQINLKVPSHVEASQWDYWDEQISRNFRYLQDDLIFEVGGQQVSNYFGAVVEGERIYISIPPMDINQESTITIMPEGEENEILLITDDSRGGNAVVAPVTMTITQDNVVVVAPEDPK